MWVRERRRLVASATKAVRLVRPCAGDTDWAARTGEDTRIPMRGLFVSACRLRDFGDMPAMAERITEPSDVMELLLRCDPIGGGEPDGWLERTGERERWCDCAPNGGTDMVATHTLTHCHSAAPAAAIAGRPS